MKTDFITNTSAKFKRQNVYEFNDGKGIRRYALVISNDYRCADNILSILMLSSNPNGRDVVQVNGIFGTYYAHCELVTTCGREQLGKNCGKISDKTMDAIERQIMKGLDLDNDVIKERDFYKTAYESLVNKLIVGEN